MISAVINYEDKRVSIHTSKAKNVSSEFIKGFYEVSTDRNGNLIIKEEPLTEIHGPYKSHATEYIIETVKAFFRPDIKEKVNKLGFIHKLGVLLYGGAGTGKSSLINYIADKMIEHENAIVFFCNNANTLSSAISLGKMVREIQNNPLIFIADEFERYAEESEAEMKNFLDGKDSIENSLFLAATNYIDKVPNTIKDRPSRFRVCQEIRGITSKDTMREILTNMSNKIDPSLFTEEEIETEVSKLSDCTIDDLKHIVLSAVTKSFVKRSSTKKVIGFVSHREEDIDIRGTSWLKGWTAASKNTSVKESNI